MPRHARHRVCTLALALAALFSVPAAEAQQSAPALDSLARVAVVASARFADRSVASASGYKRMGPDFPGMGEHWILPEALLVGGVDVEHPTLLIYATVRGAPTLLGVGFVVTTRTNEPAPNVPGWPHAWHEHSGLLSDESGVSPSANASTDTHVWVLHVWTALPNPAGTFAPDNWALPFVRAGVRAPAALEVDAARALSLLSAGDAYLRDLLTDAGLRTTANAVQVDSLIAMTRTHVANVVARVGASRTVPEEDLALLRGEWSSLERLLRAMLGEDVARYLAPPHALSAASHGHEPSR